MASTHYPDPDLFEEPTLEDLFAEPIIRLLMQCDGVNGVDLRAAMERVKQSYYPLDVVQ